jgi:RNA-directed DNA polymerase
LKKVLNPKINSKELKPFGIPTMIDRAVQAIYLLAVDPVVETSSDKYSFGFRKYRSEQDAIAYIRSLLDKPKSPQFILEVELSKCFDKISHEFLMKATPICHKHVLKE